MKRRGVVDNILKRIDNIENNPNKQFGILVSTFLDDLNECHFVEMAKTKIRMAMNEVSQIKCQQELQNQMYSSTIRSFSSVSAPSTQSLEDFAFPMLQPNLATRVNVEDTPM